jgi:hypothetical protein
MMIRMDLAGNILAILRNMNHAQNTFNILSKDNKFVKEFPITKENCSWKKEAFFKGKKTITRAIFFSRERIS